MPNVTKPVKLRGIDGGQSKKKKPANPQKRAGKAKRKAKFNAPRWMEEEGQKLFRNLAPVLVSKGYLTEASRPAFELLCANWGIVRRCYDELNVGVGAEGLLAYDDKGLPRKQPLWQPYREATAMVMSMAKEFGLTPQSIQRLVESEPGDEDLEAALR